VRGDRLGTGQWQWAGGETSVDNHSTRQYNPEDSSEHTRRRENLKFHIKGLTLTIMEASCVL
jgi:hypothetical protein